MKTCSTCKQPAELKDFYRNRRTKDGLFSYCKSCSKMYASRYRTTHREGYLSYRRKYYRSPVGHEKALKYHKSLRSRFLEMYGEKCSCCGDTRVIFLTLDHVVPVLRPKGFHYNPQEGLKEALREHRPDLYQVLCMNCNLAKGKRDRCPCGSTISIALTLRSERGK